MRKWSFEPQRLALRLGQRDRPTVLSGTWSGRAVYLESRRRVHLVGSVGTSAVEIKAAPDANEDRTGRLRQGTLAGRVGEATVDMVWRQSQVRQTSCCAAAGAFGGNDLAVQLGRPKFTLEEQLECSRTPEVGVIIRTGLSTYAFDVPPDRHLLPALVLGPLLFDWCT